jgi:hypothetical protein
MLKTYERSIMVLLHERGHSIRTEGGKTREKEWRERRGSNAPAFPRFPAEKRTQTAASQRDFLQKVN